MTEERRYRTDEINEIFTLALHRADVGRPAVTDEAGLTLAELQEIGLDVGVEPGRIAAAAQALDIRRGVLPRETSLGMPVGVGRVIPLPRAVTDREWDSLVAEFRETFHARGNVTSHGGARRWSNGNLHASLESTGTGHQLRLETVKGGAKAQNTIGVASLITAVVFITMFLTSGASPVSMEFVLLMLVGLGGGALVSNTLRLPRWAHVREGQMEYLAGRVAALLGGPPQGQETEQ